MFSHLKKIFFLAFGIPIGFLIIPLQVNAKIEFQLTSEENPPFNYTDEKSGKFVGVGTELVREVFRRAGIKYTMTAMPWVRAYQLALKNPRTCVFMTAFTAEREPLFKWVGPFTRTEWVVYGKVDTKIQVKTVEDLKKIRIGGYREDAPVTFLQKQGVEFDLVTADNLNPKKLQTGRIDGWVTNRTRGLMLAKRQGISQLNKLYTIKVTNHYLACNKGIEESSLAELNRVVKTLWAEDLINKTMSKYMAMTL